MRGSGRTVLRISSTDSRPARPAGRGCIRPHARASRYAYVRTLTRRPAGLGPTQRLTSQQTVHLELCSVDSFQL